MAATGSYVLFHERLEHLSTQPDTLKRLLDEVAEKHGWWTPQRNWVSTFARFEPKRAAYCTFVFEDEDEPQELCLIELSEDRLEETVGEYCTQVPLFGWARLTRFPSERILTTLSSLWSLPHSWRVLRYRPHRRCMLQGKDSDGGRLFAKIFPDDRGEQFYAESLARWEMREAFDFSIAPPLRWDATLKTLWEGPVAGIPAKSTLLGEDGLALARHMGSACASFTKSGIRPKRIFDASAQLGRTLKCAKEISKVMPEYAERVGAITQRFEEIYTGFPARALVPIHCAPHPSQWLLDKDKLGLVDFDGSCMGDSELDVATFVAEVDFEGSAVHPSAILNQAFIEGHEAVAGALDTERLHFYWAQKRFSKAYRDARRVDPNAPAKVAKVLEGVEALLELPV